MARKTSRIGALLALFLLCAPAVAEGQSQCANANLEPTSATTAAAADAVVCLVNVHRAEHALAPVQSQTNLRLAAEGHSADMVARHYFEHTSPEGKSVVERAAAAGYTKGHSWELGEALGVGLLSLSTPSAIVTAWLNSPPHRAVLLESRYTDIGIGIVQAMDGTGVTGAAYTAAFGHRTADVADRTADGARRTKKRSKKRRRASAKLSFRVSHRARGN